MRVAVVADIHGNLTAFEAVLADLKETAPDLILHGGDLADSGSSPVEIIDRIRDLGWPGVVGNTDELLFRPDSLKEFASSPQLKSLWDAIEEMAVGTRSRLGEERLSWLRDLPRVQNYGPMTLLHATPQSLWRAPAPEASDAELREAFANVEREIVVYGHIHRPFVRQTGTPQSVSSESAIPRHGSRTFANTGSVSLSHDGDPRASYLMLDYDEQAALQTVAVRRVEYEISREVAALSVSGLPHFEWIARSIASARPQMP